MTSTRRRIDVEAGDELIFDLYDVGSMSFAHFSVANYSNTYNPMVFIFVDTDRLMRGTRYSGIREIGFYGGI